MRDFHSLENHHSPCKVALKNFRSDQDRLRHLVQPPPTHQLQHATYLLEYPSGPVSLHFFAATLTPLPVPLASAAVLFRRFPFRRSPILSFRSKLPKPDRTNQAAPNSHPSRDRQLLLLLPPPPPPATKTAQPRSPCPRSPPSAVQSPIDSGVVGAECERHWRIQSVGLGTPSGVVEFQRSPPGPGTPCPLFLFLRLVSVLRSYSCGESSGAEALALSARVSLFRHFVHHRTDSSNARLRL